MALHYGVYGLGLRFRFRVVIYYILRAQRGSHVITSGPKYIPYNPYLTLVNPCITPYKSLYNPQILWVFGTCYLLVALASKTRRVPFMVFGRFGSLVQCVLCDRGPCWGYRSGGICGEHMGATSGFAGTANHTSSLHESTISQTYTGVKRFAVSTLRLLGVLTSDMPVLVPYALAFSCFSKVAVAPQNKGQPPLTLRTSSQSSWQSALVQT